MLALAGAPDWTPEARERALAFCDRLEQPSGLLAEPHMPGPNFAFNGLALIARGAVAGPDRQERLDRQARALVGVRGVPLPSDPAVVRQDGRLQAWSWTDGTFSWVEPTALVVIALKTRNRPPESSAARIREAEALLVDRACRPAGWNYGNSQVLGQDLRPFVPTTALALLALADRRAGEAVERGLEWLAARALDERSALALGLAAICLRVFDRSVEPIQRALGEQGDRTGFLANAHLEAVALYALTLAEHGASAFRVGGPAR
jgi:hypothetical protein